MHLLLPLLMACAPDEPDPKGEAEDTAAPEDTAPEPSFHPAWASLEAWFVLSGDAALDFVYAGESGSPYVVLSFYEDDGTDNPDTRSACSWVGFIRDSRPGPDVEGAWRTLDLDVSRFDSDCTGWDEAVYPGGTPDAWLEEVGVSVAFAPLEGELADMFAAGVEQGADADALLSHAFLAAMRLGGSYTPVSYGFSWLVDDDNVVIQDEAGAPAMYPVVEEGGLPDRSLLGISSWFVMEM